MALLFFADKVVLFNLSASFVRIISIGILIFSSGRGAVLLSL